MKTYGIQVFNESIHNELLSNWTRPGGCKELVVECQEALKERDGVQALTSGRNWREACGAMNGSCPVSPIELYRSNGYGWYDIGHQLEDPFPAPYSEWLLPAPCLRQAGFNSTGETELIILFLVHGYLTEASVLEALGVPVNFSEHSSAVGAGFGETFDMIHGGFLEAIAYLLDAGVKVIIMSKDFLPPPLPVPSDIALMRRSGSYDVRRPRLCL